MLQGANYRLESGATTWGNVILSREALAQNLSLFEAIVTLHDIFRCTGVLQSANSRPESSSTTWGNIILNREAFGQNPLLSMAEFTFVLHN